MSGTGANEHPRRFLSRSAGGGFSIQVEDGIAWQATAAGDGWRIQAPRPCRLRRSDTGGMVLESPDGKNELARTTPLEGAAHRGGSRHLLLDDGRLYRIALEGAREACFALSSWEADGAYFLARPEGDGWRIEPQAASAGITDPEVPLLMLAAEIIDAAGMGS